MSASDSLTIQQAMEGKIYLTANQTAAQITDLFPNLAHEILSYLNPKDILNLELTSRHFQDVTNDKDFWRDLLIRDFGKDAANEVKDQNFKEAYKNNYNAIKEAVRSLKCGGLILSLSSDEINPRTRIKLYGLLPPAFLTSLQYLPVEDLSTLFFRCSSLPYASLLIEAIMNCSRFSEIPSIDLEKAFENASGQYNISFIRCLLRNRRFFDGFGISAGKMWGKVLINIIELNADNNETELIQSIKLIFSHPEFNRIPASGTFGLGHAFVIAAIHGQVAAMKLIMKNERFREIPILGEFGLGHAFCLAAQEGQIVAMDLIMKNERFKEILTTGEYGLGHAFCLTILRGQINAMDQIMKNERFNQIQALEEFGLEYAFCLAAQLGQIDAMELMMKNERYKEISTRGLAKAFCLAAQFGQIGSMALIMEDERFNEKIPAMGEFGLGHAFCFAAKQGQTDAMELIMELERFNEIPALGEFGLEYALCLAAQYGQMDAMELMIKNERYKEISAIGIGQAFCLAVQFGEIGSMVLIMQDERFHEIPALGKFGLGHALSLAAQLGQMDAMDLIIEDERFHEIPAVGSDGEYGLGSIYCLASNEVRAKIENKVDSETLYQMSMPPSKRSRK